MLQFLFLELKVKFNSNNTIFQLFAKVTYLIFIRLTWCAKITKTEIKIKTLYLKTQLND